MEKMDRRSGSLRRTGTVPVGMVRRSAKGWRLLPLRYFHRLRLGVLAEVNVEYR